MSEAKLEVQINGNKIYSPLRGQWLVMTPEERVRQSYVCHLVNHYGYSLSQMDEEVVVANGQRGQGRSRADIVIWQTEAEKKAKKHSFIVVECKAQSVKIQRGDYFQGANYASWAHAKFFITTNEKETKFFKTGEIVPEGFLDEIVDIPHAKDIGDEKKIADILSQTKVFTRDEFQNLLFQCHNVIRNNDKLSPEMAFDEISKILFMKIRFERNEGKGSIFSREVFEGLRNAYQKFASAGSLPFYQHLFEQTKADFRNDEIFEPNDAIKIREQSFLSIVGLLEKYNLSDTSDDVKGIAFEQFLGRTFRGDLGQFFTPRAIVRFMTEVLDPKENELICDPCCGTGGFLINAFEYVRSQIESDIQKEKDRIKAELISPDFDTLPEDKQNVTMEKLDLAFEALNKELEPNNTGGRVWNLSQNCVFGTDAEPRSARTAKMNMIFHGDGHSGVHHHDGLLNVNGIFEERFDVILTNPPFGARVSKDYEITDADRYHDEKKIAHYLARYGDCYNDALKQITANIGKPLLSLYELGAYSTLTEILFMERNLRLLRAGGRMGVVLPEGVLNNSQLQTVREWFEGRAKIVLIVSIPQDVFMAAGATVKPSLLFLKKFTKEEKEIYETIKKDATETTEEKYATEKKRLADIIASRGKDGGNKEEKAQAKKDLKALEETIAQEIRAIVKEKFDYEIPVAQVEKAGITTTGATCENELEGVIHEFREYFRTNPLWESVSPSYGYDLAGNRAA